MKLIADTIQTKKCTKCGEVKPITDFNKQSGGKYGVRGDCKYCTKEQGKQYHQDNKEILNQKSNKYRLNNKEIINKKSNQRYQSDPLHRMKINLRSRTTIAFNSKSWHKNGGTEQMLGCDWETAFNHIQNQFEDGMSWDNHSHTGWHIDHIVPLALAKNEEELKKLCHYTNLQPMWAKPNMSKSDKLLKEHYDLHYTLLGRHYKE